LEFEIYNFDIISNFVFRASNFLLFASSAISASAGHSVTARIRIARTSSHALPMSTATAAGFSAKS